MSKRIFFLSILAATVLSACKEERIPIPSLSSGPRKVLVEELTGVRCPNCPDGTKELISLQNLYGKENLIVVGVHAASFYSVPYSNSKYDFRNDTVQAMADFLGQPLGFPTAAVNRFQKDGENTLFLLRSTWAGLIAEEFGRDFGLGLYVSNEFNALTRQLSISVNIAPEQRIDHEARLSVYVLQDSIVDPQVDKLTKIDDYTHRYVLRRILSKPDGDVLGSSMERGAVVQRQYATTLPESWPARHCSVVAFVHRSGAPDKLVLQAAYSEVLK